MNFGIASGRIKLSQVMLAEKHVHKMRCTCIINRVDCNKMGTSIALDFQAYIRSMSLSFNDQFNLGGSVPSVISLSGGDLDTGQASCNIRLIQDVGGWGGLDGISLASTFGDQIGFVLYVAGGYCQVLSSILQSLHSKKSRDPTSEVSRLWNCIWTK